MNLNIFYMYCLTYSYTALNKATSEYEKSLGSKKISDKMQYWLGSMISAG